MFFHRGNPAEPDGRAGARNEYLIISKSEPYYARRIFKEKDVHFDTVLAIVNRVFFEKRLQPTRLQGEL